MDYRYHSRSMPSDLIDIYYSNGVTKLQEHSGAPQELEQGQCLRKFALPRVGGANACVVGTTPHAYYQPGKLQLMPIKPATSLESPDLELFAHNFRKARRALKITQREIHISTGIAISYVSAVELGKKSVTLAIAGRMAKAIGMPLYKLLMP